MQYIYCGEEKTITSITDLDLLFQIYILADKVRLRSFDPVTFFKTFSWDKHSTIHGIAKKNA